MEALWKDIKTSVVNAFTTAPPAEHASKKEILGLEEAERARRLDQVSQSRVDQENAANLSCLIKGQRFPVFKGNVSKGYKRVTTKFEEDERRRRLTNKSESALRRLNANKTALMIRELGWPFIRSQHYGAEYILMNPIEVLEDDERKWRTSNLYWAATAKHNAALVANILRWNNFQKNPNAGIRRYVRLLEEKERKHRLQADVFQHAMENGYKESTLIRRLGSPFFVQRAERTQTRDSKEVHQLEELERKRRLRNPLIETQLAHELAGIVSGSLPLGQEKALEEKERGRRMANLTEERIAMTNAKRVSLMIRETSLNKIAGGPIWYSISRNSMRALEEIERTRRVRDISGQQQAKLHAKKESQLIVDWLAKVTRPSFISLEESERQTRIYDRSQQSIAIKNARKVSGLIAKHFLLNPASKSYALAMEESERSRRLMDKSQERIAENNAHKVASLVTSRNAPAPTIAKEEVSITILEASFKSAPVAPVAQQAPAVPSIPIAPISAPIIPPPIAAPVATVAPLPAPVPVTSSFSTLKTETITSQTAPLAPIVLPATTAPVPVAPLATPPATQLPAVPLVRSASSGPVLSSSGPTLASSGTSTFVSGPTLVSTGPSPILSSSGPTFVSSGGVATTYVAPAQVPIDPYVTGAAPLLGERERKKLAKEANKHNRKSEKDLKRAESQRIKAEKMHQKGRDDKAMKLENKAGYLVQMAEHEKKWANALEGELLNVPTIAPNAPAPATM